MAESGQGPRSGARDNGLRAAGYAAVGDLDPRLADSILDTLRAEGIAAYVTPTPGVSGGYLELQLPTHQTNRLYADSSQVDRAGELLAKEHGPALADEAMPTASYSAPADVAPPATTAPPASSVPDAAATSPTDIDFDAAWKQVLTSLQSTTTAATRPWPASEEVEKGAFAPATDGTLDQDPMLDEHFVPPPPPPLPRLRRVTIVGWLAVLAGIAILATNFEGGDLTWIAIASIVVGAGTLIWHVKNEPRDDSDWDDGAIV